jgi:restriction system protein
MNGYDFESFIGSLYEKMGYSVELTPKSGDQGADLIITKLGERTAVQTKNYKGKVTNKAIQEVVASKEFYGCITCTVVTNSYFTESALELGKVNNVKLVDRDELNALIGNYI